MYRFSESRRKGEARNDGYICNYTDSTRISTMASCSTKIYKCIGGIQNANTSHSVKITRRNLVRRYGKPSSQTLRKVYRNACRDVIVKADCEQRRRLSCIYSREAILCAEGRVVCGLFRNWLGKTPYVPTKLKTVQ